MARPSIQRCMHRGRQEALLRHLRGRGEEAGAPDSRTESGEQRSGDHLKQELINMAGKALVSMPCFNCRFKSGLIRAAAKRSKDTRNQVATAGSLSLATTYAWK